MSRITGILLDNRPQGLVAFWVGGLLESHGRK